MKTRAVSLAILMLGATGVALADQDDHHWERDHDRGHGWTARRSSPVQAPEIDPSSIEVASCSCYADDRRAYARIMH
jgi:hypothetical protein